MAKKSIYKQMLIPMIGIVLGLAMVLLLIIGGFFSSFYKNEIYARNKDKVNLINLK